MRATIVIILLSLVPLGVAWGWMTDSGPVTSSIFAGLWGAVMVWATVAAKKRLARNPPEVPGEHVIFRSPANHLRVAEGVGGWLIMTDDRLLFRPHKLNVQTEDWSVPLAEVARLEPRSTAWVIPNGIRVVSERGEERFVVDDRARWVDEFRQATATKQ